MCERDMTMREFTKALSENRVSLLIFYFIIFFFLLRSPAISLGFTTFG